jgi:hypothetical protein
MTYTMNEARLAGVKVFSATKARDRDQLGEKITLWLRANPQLEILEKTVTLSSDAEFHCLTVVLFWSEQT